MKKFIMMLMVFCFMCVGTAFALTDTIIPVPTCPDCIVTCPAIPACPDVTLNCSDNSTSFPGVWKATFKGKQHCGKVTGYGDQIVMYDEWGKQFEWLVVDKKLIMQSVETCGEVQ